MKTVSDIALVDWTSVQPDFPSAEVGNPSDMRFQIVSVVQATRNHNGLEDIKKIT